MINKKQHCPLNYTMNLIGTKWKPLILFHLLEGELRSGELQKQIPSISNKMFTQTVRELEKDGLIYRKVFPVSPPKVEYKLSKRGKSLENILRNLDKWGMEDNKNTITD
ncbi:putative transcriptional regulator [Bernardetia litoralis DSM 6794]|uniref:Putative transcriptional regulator n=1 Tax=Bernardetia litoralis (strain ATCC 23117 / DSM 6794 / NBRC 15988 / NCIMB 1366 / Fx l1 / Sio-4) TaxID=880071 RepID=I4APS1_BERLS|nr:helix-turn-helix domain-containing protein [Bernardetia litoralis]AFM05956.1 putative transcriptional regulator [Bernardetia litoralis DSM 6794]